MEDKSYPAEMVTPCVSQPGWATAWNAFLGLLGKKLLSETDPRVKFRGPRETTPRHAHRHRGVGSRSIANVPAFRESAGLVHPGIMGQNDPLATNFKPWLNGDGTERSGAGQARPRSSETGRSCLVREPETPRAVTSPCAVVWPPLEVEGASRSVVVGRLNSAEPLFESRPDRICRSGEG